MSEHAAAAAHDRSTLDSDDDRPLIFDRRSIQAVDREAIEGYGIPGIVLMENAALGLATVATAMTARDATVLVVCGSGNNGGDGYALARHLAGRGRRPTLLATRPPRAGTDAAVNHEICRRMDLPFVDPDAGDVPGIELIVDALFGTGLDRPVEGRAAELIAWMNAASADVLAVDVPSGLDCQTGAVLGDAVVATRTVTFVGWKTGFLAPEARRHLGIVDVIDIGAPRALYEKHGRPLPTREGPSGDAAG